MTRYEQAVSGIDSGIAMGRKAVRVRDGNDTWVAPRVAWDKMVAVMDGGEGAVGCSEPLADDEGGMEAYSELCRRVAGGGLIVSVTGVCRGSDAEQATLVRDAIAEGLLDEDEALAKRYAKEA